MVIAAGMCIGRHQAVETQAYKEAAGRRERKLTRGMGSAILKGCGFIKA